MDFGGGGRRSGGDGDVGGGSCGGVGETFDNEFRDGGESGGGDVGGICGDGGSFSDGTSGGGSTSGDEKNANFDVIDGGMECVDESRLKSKDKVLETPREFTVTTIRHG